MVPDDSQRERERILSELISDIAYVIRVDGDAMVPEWVSDSFTRLTGFTVEHLRDAPGLMNLIHPPDLHHVPEQIEALRAGSPSTVEIRFTGADGRLHWFQVYLQPVHDEHGRLLRFYGAAQDVTDRKRAERELQEALAAERAATRRLREMDRLKDEFLSTLSHELRAPLTSVVGFGEVLLDEEGDPRHRRMLEGIVRSAREMGAMVTQLLEYSRLDAGTADLSPEPLDLGRALADTLAALGPALARHHVETEVPEGLTVPADAVALSHVLRNLLENAAKYSPDGTTIRVRARSCGPEVGVEVSDEGPGIEVADLDRVFERFYRSPSVVGGIPGTGLGLSIAKWYVEAQGGRIGVESTPGRGSTFSFTLPL